MQPDPIHPFACLFSWLWLQAWSPGLVLPAPAPRYCGAHGAFAWLCRQECQLGASPPAVVLELPLTLHHKHIV